MESIAPESGMAKNEEGEFELILGNKQLLSVFFIVVILLGVFFTMGYVVGRNSVPMDAQNRGGDSVSASARTEAPRPSGPPVVVDPPAKTGELTTAQAPEATPTTSKAPEGVATSPAPTRSEPAKNASPGEVVTPQPGEMYVQVLALAKPEAEVLVDVLSKKGFRAVVAPGPNDRLFRVLVGPAADQNELAKLRNEVEAAGFKGAFPKKY
ncbi:MAG TPA: SPOR domain-containing protein [Bryobacteraceae bacterium]|nr:SPOR domain-containing protein [Bryobacteraceae bacterium]